MAEALEVAASGIAVAQIAMKDVPDGIADLMDQIDCLDPVLWEVENGFNKGELPSMLWDDLASKSTTRYCRKALENLTAMVEELNLQISSAKKGRRKITAIKVLLKKDSIKKLERRLENAVRMLTLAQQSYLVALTQVQPDIIVQKFTTLTIRRNQYESQETSDYASESEVQTVSRLCHKHQDTDISMKPLWAFGTGWIRPTIFGRVCFESFAAGSRILFQAPAWLSRRSWELHSIKANGAWQFNLRSYRLIPKESELISLVRKGSPQDIQRLFDAGLASPYDYTRDGQTLLQYALRSHNIEVVKYLIRIGLSGLAEDVIKWSYVLFDVFTGAPQTSFFTKQVTSDPSLAGHLLGYPEDPKYDDNMRCLLSRCNCQTGSYNPAVNEALLPYRCPSHRSTSLRSRLERAREVLKRKGSIEVFRLILEPDWSTNPKAVHSHAILPIITVVAYRLGAAVADLLRDYESLSRPININHLNASVRDYFTFTVDIIKETPNIHVFSSDRHYPSKIKGTAMAYVIRGITGQMFWYQIRPCLASKLVRLWLEALKQAGINLEAYGRREKEIFAGKSYDILAGNGSEKRLVDFRYGPEPEDWEFYFGEPIDDYVGEFWKLVEDPPLRVPGAWADDDNHYDGDDYNGKC
ncbi:uncharacterized protein F4817DRAFT_360756 [Daldinia loculata]|uniref:uncharacterized protein n=1 Tax=Daldinia loculata TaxID=103429 RepID=UPI0020C44384|nr:uncharacterized protein F4817DRAFT_360756 [Daldinia loculata]KAI1644455.1 hypothetical protein F4817DRAFT_360756 [Daldinia loculata]